MISISTISQNTSGDLVIYELPASKFHDSEARVNRMSTLDGGCVITHSGFCDADRTFDIKARLNEADTEILRDIYRDETLINLATPEAFFRAAIEHLKSDNGDIRLTLLIKERLST